MKKDFLYWAVCIILTACIFSCNEFDDDYIGFSEKEITFDGEGGALTAIVTANGGWTVKDKPDWCTITPAGATVSTEVVIFATYNKGEKREGVIRVARGKAEASIAIIQNEIILPSISITPTQTGFTAAGGSTEIEVTANSEWVISSEPPAWCSFNVHSGSTSEKITLTVEENNNEEKRDTTVIFKSGAAQAILIIAQEPKGPAPTVGVDEEEFTVPAAGEEKKIQVTSNGEWQITTVLPEWCHVEPTSGTGNTEITITIDPLEEDNEEGRNLTIGLENTTANASISITQDPPTPGEISLSEEELNFTPEGGTSIIKVTANGKWEILDEIPDWCTITPTEGTGDGDITVTVQKYEGPRDNNLCILHFKRGSADAELTINQEEPQEDEISFVETEALFTAQGGSKTVDLKANGEWSLLTTDLPAWLTIAPSQGNTDATLTITAEENTETTERSQVITFKRGEATADLTIKQEKAVVEPSITLSNNTPQAFSAEGGEINITVTANDKWSVDATTIPEWCEITPTNGDISGEITVKVSPNESFVEEKNAEITFNCGTANTKLTIRQEKAVLVPSISLNNNTPLAFNAEGGEINITVTTNDKWSVDESTIPDWCFITPHNGNTSGEITVRVNPNNNIEERNTEITFNCGTASTKLIINQAKAETILSISKGEVSFNATGGQESINLTANKPWQISGVIPTWCTITPLSGDASQEITINVQANPDATERSTDELKIQTDGANTSLIIKQEAAPFLNLSDNVLGFLRGGGTQMIELEANGPWEVLTDGLPEWCELSPMNGDGNTDLAVKVLRNETGEDRDTKLKIQRGTLESELEITQSK